MNSTLKTVLIWILIVVAAVGLWNFVEHGRSGPRTIDLTDFLNHVENGRVAEVTIAGSSLTGRLRPDNQFFQSTMVPGYAAVYDKLIAAGVKVKVIPTDQQSWFTVLISWFMPMLVAFGLGWRCALWSQRQRLQPPMTTA